MNIDMDTDMDMGKTDIDKNMIILERKMVVTTYWFVPILK